MQFNPSHPGYEAGVTVWWNQYSYATIGISLVELANGEQVRTVVYRQPTGTAGVIKTVQPLVQTSGNGESAAVPDGAVDLRVETQPTGYTLTLTSVGVSETFSFSTSDLTVMPRVGGAFCGVLFGIFSFGKGEPVLDPADFSEIYIQEGALRS